MPRGNCVGCGEKIPENRNRQARYCSARCATAHYRSRHLTNPSPYLDRPATGAAHELLATIALLQRHYYVFRNVSASGPCDLIAMKDGKLLKVEVGTCQHYSNGKVSFQKKNQRHDFDLYLSVSSGGQVFWLDRNYSRFDVTEWDIGQQSRYLNTDTTDKDQESGLVTFLDTPIWMSEEKT